jgi:hypothetical protein
MKIRPDLTVIMVAPKCPGTEVREEYKRGFGVPTLIAVHTGERSQRRRPRDRQGLRCRRPAVIARACSSPASSPR